MKFSSATIEKISQIFRNAHPDSRNMLYEFEVYPLFVQFVLIKMKYVSYHTGVQGNGPDPRGFPKTLD